MRGIVPNIREFLLPTFFQQSEENGVFLPI